MVAYKNAWDDDNRANNAPDMAFEDLFEDDDDAIEGAREEMIETYEMEECVWCRLLIQARSRRFRSSAFRTDLGMNLPCF